MRSRRTFLAPRVCSRRSPAAQVYEGLTFKLSLKFPTSYPYEAPQVTFQTPCFHPNVDQYGNICLDILKVSAPSPLARPSARRLPELLRASAAVGLPARTACRLGPRGLHVPVCVRARSRPRRATRAREETLRTSSAPRRSC